MLSKTKHPFITFGDTDSSAASRLRMIFSADLMERDFDRVDKAEVETLAKSPLVPSFGFTQDRLCERGKLKKGLDSRLRGNDRLIEHEQ